MSARSWKIPLGSLVCLLVLVACPDLGSRYVEPSTTEDQAPAVADEGDDTAAPGDQAPPSAADVYLRLLAFNPPEVRITVGGTVTWHNRDTVDHTLNSGTSSAPTHLFDSMLLNQGASFTYTFADAGTYHYFCGTHAKVMDNGVVDVVEVGP